MSAAHIVELPGFVTIIRIVQLVLSIVILGLAGNTLSTFNLGVDALGFVVFCCVWTLLVNAYLLVTPIFFPIAYNMWGHLALESLAWIFWLSAWAAAASWASVNSGYSGFIGKVYSAWATGAAAAGMGAIMWILFTVTLVFFCLRLHAHRTNPNNAHLSSLGFAEKGGESHQMGAVQQPVQQQQYPVSETAPTPVQGYVTTPPPQQWQQSPPPQQQY